MTIVALILSVIVVLILGVTLVRYLLAGSDGRAGSGAAPEPTDTSAREKEPPDVEGKAPRRIDENVLFTVYRPKVIDPDRWYVLLALAHLSERRPDSPPSAPDPAERVKEIAERVYGPKHDQLLATATQSTQGIPEGEDLTFVPAVEGLRFNPKEVKVSWLEDVQHAEFRFSAEGNGDGKTLRGRLSVYAGVLLVADVPLSIKVSRARAGLDPDGDPVEAESARPYDKIFASYSHLDTPVVEAFEAYVKALGHTYLRDVTELRSGEVWSERLKELIEEAQVFQLFWSSNSMASDFVRQELEHALSLGRPYFVRPVYWEEPLPRKRGLPPKSLDVRHFYKFTPAGPRPRDPEPQVRAAPPAPSPAQSNYSLKMVLPILLVGVFAYSMFKVYQIMPQISWGNDVNVNVNTNANTNANMSYTPTPTPPPSPPPSRGAYYENYNSRADYARDHAEYRVEARAAGETVGQGVEDGWIHFKVRAAVAADLNIRDANISVDVVDGVVMLRGLVISRLQSEAATRAARRVEGVKEVRNEIIVLPH